MPRRNFKNSSKTPPFLLHDRVWGDWSNSCCDVYPGRSNISRPLISLRMMQNIFEKYGETLSRGAIGCCSNIPDLKKDILLYNLMAMICQRYNKNVNHCYRLLNKRTNSVRLNHRRTSLSGICSADFQTLFSNFSAESEPETWRDTNDNLYLPIPQYFKHQDPAKSCARSISKSYDRYKLTVLIM